MDKLVFYYFNIKARNQLPLLLLHAGGIDYEWNIPANWPDMKPLMPFEQLPYLTHGPIKLAQSGAIVRYIAKLAKMDGRTVNSWAQHEMLISASDDIYQLFREALHAKGDKAAAWDELVVFKLPTHFKYLEKLLDPSGLFTSEGVGVGDLAVFSVLILALDAEPFILKVFPKLKAFYDTVAALPRLQSYLQNQPPVYYKRVTADTENPDAPAPEPDAAAPSRPVTGDPSGMPVTDYGNGKRNLSGQRILQPPGGRSSFSLAHPPNEGPGASAMTFG